MADVAVDVPETADSNGGAELVEAEPKSTVLAPEDSVSGKLQLRGSGEVLGSFSGQIECDGDLLIGPEARVEADIRGVRVTVAGLVRGNIVADTRLKITSTGRLEGDATVGALVVQEGGVHHGVIRVHPEGLPEVVPQPTMYAARSTVVPLKTLNPVGRVRKFWGEFF